MNALLLFSAAVGFLQGDGLTQEELNRRALLDARLAKVRVSLQPDKTDLAAALRSICSQADLRLEFAPGVVELAASLPVSKSISEQTLSAAIAALVEDATAPLRLLNCTREKDVLRVDLEEEKSSTERIPIEKRTYVFSGARLPEAVREIAGSTGINYVVADDPADRATIDLKMVDMSPLAAVIKVLRTYHGGTRYSVRFRGDLLSLTSLRTPVYAHEKAAVHPVYVRATDVDVYYLIAGILSASGHHYVLDPNVHGRVSLTINALAPLRALDRVLKSAPNPAKREVQNGVYLVAPKTPASRADPAAYPKGRPQ